MNSATINRSRGRVLSRRYYPLAIGAAFLGLVVGFFPSTVPTSTLGFVPRISVPTRVATVAPSPAPTVSRTAPAVVPVSPSFPESPSLTVAGGGAIATGPVVTEPSTSTGASGTGKVGTGPQATCPLPLPAEPPAPAAAELIELYSAAGPFGPEATAGAPLLAPVVPVVAPLFPLAGGFAGGKSGTTLSTTLVEIANLEDALFAPFSSQIAAFTPGAVSDSEHFYQEIGPLLTLASSLPDLTCVGDVEIAAGATVEPNDYPGAVPLTKYGAAADAGSQPASSRVAVISAPWAEGITPALAGSINALIAQGTHVEVRLINDPPAGHAADDQGFASWVRTTIGQYPKVAIWEIDSSDAATAASGSVAPTDPVGSLIAALTAAAQARAPGQLLGVGLPALDSATWWPQMAGALDPQLRAELNFVGVDTTALTGGTDLSPAGLRWLVTLARQVALAQAGLPESLPLFVEAGTGTPLSLAAQATLAAQDAASLAGLGVGLLTWSSPSTVSGQMSPGDPGADTLFAALVRPPSP